MPWLTEAEKAQVEKGELTDHEHHCLEILERNKNMANQFLFKGHEIGPAVGDKHDRYVMKT